jgi:hypothetical protein
METFFGSISVKFKQLPSIDLVSIVLRHQTGHLLRIAEATRKRYFTLREDWLIELDNIDYAPELNGCIQIPKAVEGKTIEFDGASIPMPWLSSFLTLGIMRPLGVLLTASILHDFAFKFGYLNIMDKDGKVKSVPVSREVIDRLFRDIVSTVNGVASIGWITWFFVRLGWLFGVKYNGKRFAGNCPYGVISIVLCAISALLLYLFQDGSYNKENLRNVLSFIAAFYFMIASMIILTLSLGKKSRL